MKFHSKSELSVVYKTKAQQQAELADLAEVLFISVLEAGDDSDGNGLSTTGLMLPNIWCMSCIAFSSIAFAYFKCR